MLRKWELSKACSLRDSAEGMENFQGSFCGGTVLWPWVLLFCDCAVNIGTVQGALLSDFVVEHGLSKVISVERLC